MLDVYISQLIKDLNLYLDFHLGAGSSVIKTANLIYLKEEESLRNKILCGIVDISREKDMGNASDYVADGNIYRERRAPLLFNVDLLFASNFESNLCLEGLRYLGAIIGFFQANSSMSVENNDGVKEILSLRISSMDEEKLSSLWRRIDSAYLPSFVCNISTIVMRGYDLNSRSVPRIESVDIKL